MKKIVIFLAVFIGSYSFNANALNIGMAESDLPKLVEQLSKGMNKMLPKQAWYGKMVWTSYEDTTLIVLYELDQGYTAPSLEKVSNYYCSTRVMKAILQNGGSIVAQYNSSNRKVGYLRVENKSCSG